MASNIDASKPISGTPTTASVRANFAEAKSEIEALQLAVPRMAVRTITQDTIDAGSMTITFPFAVQGKMVQVWREDRQIPWSPQTVVTLDGDEVTLTILEPIYSYDLRVGDLVILLAVGAVL